jgi:hypothetical protein
MCLDSFLIISSSLALHKRNGSGGAGGQTVAQTVAVVIAEQSGFSVYHTDGTFVTGGSTGTASVAQALVNLNNSPYHIVCLLFRFLIVVLDLMSLLSYNKVEKSVVFPTNGGES